MTPSLFLPTPSARRATQPTPASRWISVISTHALREEGDFEFFLADQCAEKISTHALREEGDGVAIGVAEHRVDFYPRPPRGGRLPGRAGRHSLGCISTHALREEGDPALQAVGGSRPDFYPRPPRGGRPFTALVFLAVFVFLPTPSARRATRCSQTSARWPCYFYPRPPRGGRPEEVQLCG